MLPMATVTTLTHSNANVRFGTAVITHVVLYTRRPRTRGYAAAGVVPACCVQFISSYTYDQLLLADIHQRCTCRYLFLTAERNSRAAAATTPVPKHCKTRILAVCGGVSLSLVSFTSSAARCAQDTARELEHVLGYLTNSNPGIGVFHLSSVFVFWAMLLAWAS